MLFAFYAKHSQIPKLYVGKTYEADDSQHATYLYDQDFDPAEWQLVASETLRSMADFPVNSTGWMQRAESLREQAEKAGHIITFEVVISPIPGPRKRIPDVPVEVWNKTKFDEEKAMDAIRDLCKGQTGSH